MLSTIQFTNSMGETLRGILHSPEKSHRVNHKDLIVFPNGGIMGCEGDFRAYVRMADFLAEAGFYVLRFSPSGFGYSDGFINACNQRDLFGKIETGMLVDDIKAAVYYSEKNLKPDSIVLSGICGGAISSLLASSIIKSVNYIISIGAPIVLDSAENIDLNRMDKDKAKRILGSYFIKIFSFSSWVRLFSFKSDISVIKTAFKKIFFRKESDPENDLKEANAQVNPEFFKAVEKILKDKKKILFVYGASDHLCSEFQNLYVKRKFNEQENLPFDIHLVPNGNHMLSLVEMQFDAVKVMLNWLKAHINE